MKPLRRLETLVLFLLMLAIPPGTARAIEALRIGLTPTFLNERHALMADWRAYLEAEIGRPVAFVLRDSYQETMELLRDGKLDAAWLCDCPHVTANQEFRLLVTPLFQGRPYYRSYLVVPEEDHATARIMDLKGKVFAYTDPYSNVGYLSPRYELRKQGEDPDRFFRRAFHAGSHRKAIEAVAVGVADGASVNSYIWETIHKQAPALTGRTRVAARSQEYGFPPLVVGRAMPARTFHDLQRALIGMNRSAQGLEVLARMNLDGFTKPMPEIYRPVQDMVRFMRDR